MEATAEALLKHETIEGKHVHEILKYGEMRSPVKEVQTEKKPKKKVIIEEEAQTKQKGKEVITDTDTDTAKAIA